MTSQLPERADMTFLRHRAKSLLVSLKAQESEAVALAAAHDPSLLPASAQLADAQRILAREFGFPSWSALKAEVETPRLREEFVRLVRAGDAASLDKLLRRSSALRREIDRPVLSFDSPAIVASGGNRAIVDVLLKYGANPNVRSSWWAGGFGALDLISDEAAEYLLSRGAKLDVWSAAAHGKVAKLAAMLDEDPELVNAPGGDGMRPLHFASSLEVVDLLLDRGADPDIRDVDHEGTPAQHLAKKPDLVRRLIERGAAPDIFLAAIVDDSELVRRLMAADPSVVNARIGEGAFRTVKSDGGHIYLYTLGGGKSPQQVAAERGSEAALAELLRHSTPAQRLITAAWLERADDVDVIVREHPGIVGKLGRAELRALPDAAQAGKLATVRLLLRAGLSPMTSGLDQGTALHTAAWYGRANVVEEMLRHVPVETRDGVHGSTPLGWALHGSQHCRNAAGDYPRCVELILDAGALRDVAANSVGTSYLDQAGDREDVKNVLRRYGIT